MFELSIVVNFEAAHNIVGYPGKCQRLHGHNWKIEITVLGKKLDKLGMLIDFKDLKQEVNKVAEDLDHCYLNELEPFTKNNPTAENISKYLYEKLASKDVFSEKKIKIKSAKVWEFPNSAISYCLED